MPDKFLMVLDMDEGNLSFIVEGNYLGHAHTGLRGKKVYITVRYWTKAAAFYSFIPFRCGASL